MQKALEKTHEETHKVYLEVAERMIQRYARGLLTGEHLVARLLSGLAGQEELEGSVLEARVRGFCSQALCEGCQASDSWIREQAFENLGRFLRETLASSSTAAGLRADGQDAEVIQQTLLEIWSIFQRQGAGPDCPAAFLGWARVILLRQLSRHFKLSRRVVCCSLEAQAEPIFEELVNERDVDPLDTVLQEEGRAELQEAIRSLKNPLYQRVLLATFFSDLEVRELAIRWQVRAQDIHLWRCRALKALRKSSRLAELVGLGV